MCTYIDMNKFYNNGRTREIDIDENYENLPFNRQQMSLQKDDTELKKYVVQNPYNTPCSSRKSIQENRPFSPKRTNQQNHSSDVNQTNIEPSLLNFSEEKNTSKHEKKIVKYYHSKCLYYYFVLTIINLIVVFLYFFEMLYDCTKSDFINDKILFGKIDVADEFIFNTNDNK